MSYVKLDTQILASTLWLDRDARDVFLTALLLAEPRELHAPAPVYRVEGLVEAGWTVAPGWYGFVAASGPGLVAQARVDPEAGLAALARLAEADPHSRTTAYDGRRLVRVAGGYLVLNYMRYRDRDHSAAERMRRLRDRRQARHRSSDPQGDHGIAIPSTDYTEPTSVAPVTRNARHVTRNRRHVTRNVTDSRCRCIDIPPPPPRARAREATPVPSSSASDIQATTRAALPPAYQPDYDALLRGSPAPDAVAREVAVTLAGRSPTAEGATPEDVGRGIRALLLAGANRARLGRYVRTAMLQRTQPFPASAPRAGPAERESEYELLARRYDLEEQAPCRLPTD